MLRALVAVLLSASAVAFPATARAGAFEPLAAPELAPVLPPGFSENVVWSGLWNPTVIRFARDGSVIVGTKYGVIWRYDGLDDPTPTQVADLSANVHDFWDRGLLGLALAPNGADIYVLYAHDKEPWGDGCPTPPGATADGCVIDGRLSRLDAGGEHVLIDGEFCQQFPSHSVGSLEFGPDGMLYVSAGEGANFDFPDYGQVNHNPCGDPPNEGGALRAQSFRRPAREPATLDGAILRVDPATGKAAPGNPASGDPNRARIVAYGFRNPFRFTFRPGTGELWAGDVGWGDWEEIDRVPDIRSVRNYGWPCYEGRAAQTEYDSYDLGSCESLYDAGPSAVTAPYYTYSHTAAVVPGDGCGTTQSSISGLAFYDGPAFPAAYDGALFFSDYARRCIWVMPAGKDGLPGTPQLFAGGAAGPVFLTQGPDGALYYADLEGGTIRRIAYKQPVARIAATPDHGDAPLDVGFDATGSTGVGLTYAWDLDGDGAFDDSTAARPSRRFTSGPVTVGLRVTDANGLKATAFVTIRIGMPPKVTIAQPAAGTTWAVGDRIEFSGSAEPASTLHWSLDLRHCARTDPNACHTHPLQEFDGPSGSFVAPDHEYPSHLELTVEATSAGGLTSSKTLRLDPRTADITLASSPPGLQLTVGTETERTPFTVPVIARSALSLAAPSTQELDGVPYAWASWDGGLGRVHTATAPDGGSASYTAEYAGPPPTPLPSATATPIATVPPPRPRPPAPKPAAPPEPVAAWSFDDAHDASLHHRTVSLGGAARARGRYGRGLSIGRGDRISARAPWARGALTVEAWVAPRQRHGSIASAGRAWALYPGSARVGARRARGHAPHRRHWTHLALTYDGRTLRRYVDGEEAGTRRRHGRIPASPKRLRLGRGFNGRIDEVRVYDRALTPAEIRADMRTPIS